MKPSIYNVFVQGDGIIWGFNTRTMAFVRLLPTEYENVERIMSDGVESPDLAELRSGLVRGQFLISDDFDELEFLKIKNRMSRFGHKGIGLIIAPTLRCNLKCPYCYVDRNTGRMTQEVRGRVARFLERKLESHSRAVVCWTGGDPSLALPVVEDLSRRFIRVCEEKESSYQAVMISNAYLLDRRMLNALHAARIVSLQVTLDGAQEHHDLTRALVNGGPTYWRIIDNMAEVCDEISIELRINVDVRNHRSVPRLLEDLVSRNLAGRLKLYFAHVEPVNAHAEPYRDHCLATAEYARSVTDLDFLALQHGFEIAGGVLGCTPGCFCGANSINQFVIDPKGNLMKCYEDFGTAEVNGIGHIDESGAEVITRQANLFKWLAWDPFEKEECRSCKVLPLCMGGCSYQPIRNGLGIGPGCIKFKHNLADVLQAYGERLSQEKMRTVPVRSGGMCSNL